MPPTPPLPAKPSRPPVPATPPLPPSPLNPPVPATRPLPPPPLVPPVPTTPPEPPMPPVPLHALSAPIRKNPRTQAHETVTRERIANLPAREQDPAGSSAQNAAGSVPTEFRGFQNDQANCDAQVLRLRPTRRNQIAIPQAVCLERSLTLAPPLKTCTAVRLGYTARPPPPVVLFHSHASEQRACRALCFARAWRRFAPGFALRARAAAHVLWRGGGSVSVTKAYVWRGSARLDMGMGRRRELGARVGAAGWG
jgi:hypothetical protein